MLKSILLAFLLSVFLSAQTSTYSLSAVPKLQFVDQNGKPYSGGLLFTCVGGSTCPGTPQNSYSDAFGTPNTNPVVLDAAGRATVFLDTSLTYKFVLETAQGVVIYTQDGVVAAAGGGATVGATILQQFTGAISIPLNQFATDQFIDARSCGVIANNPGFDNAPAINRCIAFAAANATTPGIVLLPPGEFWVGSTILIDHSGVRLIGSGFGSGSEYSTPTTGTIIHALPGFGASNSGANLWQNYVIALNGAPGLNGARAEWLTVDSGGTTDGLFVGHANQQSGYSYITVENFRHYGLLVCGASVAYASCGGNSGGASSDGPYENLVFIAGLGATANTLPFAFAGPSNSKGLHHVSITAAGQNAAGYVGNGNGMTISDVDIHGSAAGIEVGGSSGCPTGLACGGMTTFSVNNVNWLDASTQSGHTVDLYSCPKCTLSNVGNLNGSGGTAVATSFGSTIVGTDATLGWLTTRGNAVISSDPAWTSDYAGAFQVDGALNATGLLSTSTGVQAPYVFSNGATPGSLVQGSYLGWNMAGTSTGETDFINDRGSGTGGFYWYSNSGTAPGSLLGSLTPASGGTLNIGGGGVITSGNLMGGALVVPVATISGNVGAGSVTAGSTSTGIVTSTASGNNDNFGRLALSGSTDSATYNFTGAYTHEPYCVASFDGGVVNAFASPVLSNSGTAWSIHIHASTSITGVGTYQCGLIP